MPDRTITIVPFDLIFIIFYFQNGGGVFVPRTVQSAQTSLVYVIPPADNGKKSLGSGYKKAALALFFKVSISQ